MESISPSDLALELLNHCLRGTGWPAGVLDSLLDAALDGRREAASEAGRALFGIVAEGLSDRFEPSLCETYAEIFSHVLARAVPGWRAEDLLERYRRVRAPRRCGLAPGSVRRVVVLSRVTLGADVAVTSVLMDAAKRAFPRAAIVLAGARKAYELFAADPRIEHAPLEYGRAGLLRERVEAGLRLREALAGAEVVIDPDSRITQLGLLPVCEEERYFFFESRSYGGCGLETLPVLASRWAGETFGAADARPFLAVAGQPPLPDQPVTAVSLGVGENPAKRIGDPFEEHLLAGLLRDGGLLVVDRGAGGEERRRVDRALARVAAPPGRVMSWDGAFAPFASIIARSRLYVGYDSAGQHVAAACGVPLVSVFAGYASPRMFWRWRPEGRGPYSVIQAAGSGPDNVLVEALSAAYRLWNRHASPPAGNEPSRPAGSTPR